MYLLHLSALLMKVKCSSNEIFYNNASMKQASNFNSSFHRKGNKMPNCSTNSEENFRTEYEKFFNNAFVKRASYLNQSACVNDKHEPDYIKVNVYVLIHFLCVLLLRRVTLLSFTGCLTCKCIFMYD